MYTRNNVKSKLKYWKPTESYIVGLQLHVHVLEKNISLNGLTFYISSWNELKFELGKELFNIYCILGFFLIKIYIFVQICKLGSIILTKNL